jgi:hypothetical protein
MVCLFVDCDVEEMRVNIGENGGGGGEEWIGTPPSSSAMGGAPSGTGFGGE